MKCTGWMLGLSLVTTVACGSGKGGDGIDPVDTCLDSACFDVCPDDFVDLNGDQGDGCECAITLDGVEVCDGEDNDCDGLVDDGDDSFSPDLALCPVEGICAGVTPQTLCDAAQEACDEEHYFRELGDAFIGFEALELDDDGADNNCNGGVDELLCARDEALSPLRFLERQGGLGFEQQIQPQVAITPDRSPEETRLAVVWTENTIQGQVPGDVNAIVVAFFDIFGNELHVDTLTDSPENIRDPQIIWDGDAFLVAWLAIGDDTQSVMVRRFDTSGQVVPVDGASERRVGSLFTQLDTPQITQLTMLPTDTPGRALVGWIEAVCDPFTANNPLRDCVHLTYSDSDPNIEEIIEASAGAGTLALATTGTKHFVAWREAAAPISIDWHVIGSALDVAAPEAEGTINTGLVSEKHISADVAGDHFLLAHTAFTTGGDKVQLSVFETQDTGAPQTIDIPGSVELNLEFPEVVGLGERASVVYFEGIAGARGGLQTSKFASVEIGEEAPDIDGVLLELEGNFAEALLSPSPVAHARGPGETAFFVHSFKLDGLTHVALMHTTQRGSFLCLDGE